MQRLTALLVRPFTAYNSALERSPLSTKSVTSGVMYCAGDALAQYGEHWSRHHSGAGSGGDKREAPRFKLNYARLGVFLVYGTVRGGEEDAGAVRMRLAP